jgi:hypothetical protein
MRERGRGRGRGEEKEEKTTNLGHDVVGDIQTRVLPHFGFVQTENVEQPEIRLTTIFKFQSTKLEGKKEEEGK